MSFKDDFLKTPPGPAREALIFNAAVKQGKPKDLTPITITDAKGNKITYKVQPDVLTIDGIRVTPAPATAQKIANYFGMKLPTDKMSKQIYDAANTKIRAVPLSGAGYTGKDGKYYSGADVVKNHINSSDAALEYSKRTDEELAKLKKDNLGLIAGHGKEILQPLGDARDVSFGGWQGSDGKALQPYGTAHKGGAETHSEYGLYARLVDDNITVTTPDGKTITTTMDKFLSNPDLGKAISNNNKVVTYNAPKDLSKNKPTQIAQYTPDKPQSGRAQLLSRIDKILSEIS